MPPVTIIIQKDNIEEKIEITDRTLTVLFNATDQAEVGTYGIDNRLTEDLGKIKAAILRVSKESET